MICEVMRCYMLKQIDKYKREIAIGEKSFDLQYAYHRMSREDLIDVENMVDEYLVFADEEKFASYYSVEDILKTDF